MEQTIFKNTRGGRRKEASLHTVSRPLRVAGKQVAMSGEAERDSRAAEHELGVIRREYVVRSNPRVLDLPVLPAPEPPAAEAQVLQEEEEEDLNAQWEERLKEEVAAAREEAYGAGYEAARSELKQDFDEKAEKLRADVARIQQEMDHYRERSEVMLVDLAFDIAEAVVSSPITVSAREAAGDAIASAVERLAGTHPVTVRLHSVDLLRLRETGLVDQLSGAYPALRWEPDAALPEGDWSVESPDAVLRHFAEEVLAEMRERLLAAPAKNQQQGQET